ncbi:methyltransferase [Pelistega indica]|uniref:Methyltransferase n=2 Tax=Pelistega TaxID=106146 RepID=V8FYI1_9BURK|nr:class I SAM-dependent methyltransferase [Pelistega indica]ETD69334.1 methyltransferase [Pelistega indica]
MNNASIDHFNASAREWDKRHTSNQLAPLPQKLLSKVKFDKHMHVLDFGAGTGLLATAVAPLVEKVTALDTSTEMLKVLSEKGFANIETVEKDIFEGLPEKYDVIVSSMAMHHVKDTQGLFHAFANSLNPDGELALIDLFEEDGTFHGNNIAKGVQHFGFDPDKLSEYAEKAGFTHIQISEIHRLVRDNGRIYPQFLMQAVKKV